MSDAQRAIPEEKYQAGHRIATVGAVLALIAPRKGYDARMGLRAHADVTAPAWQRDRAIWRIEVTRRPTTHPNATAEVFTSIDTMGWIKAGALDATEERGGGIGQSWTEYKRDASNAYAPTSGYWYLSHMTDRVRDVLLGLPRSAEVQFDVCLDYGTTPNMAKAGLHGDMLFLRAFINKVTPRRDSTVQRAFLIDVSCGPHNTARFGSPGVR